MWRGRRIQTPQKMMGMTLLPILIFVVIIIGMATAVGLPRAHAYYRKIDVRTAANEQMAVATSFFNYVAANSAKLQQILAGNTGVTVACGAQNCVNPLTPTPAELQAAGFANVPLTAHLGGAYKFIVANGAGGTEAQIVRTAPVTVPGSTVIDFGAESQMTTWINHYSPAFANTAGWSTTNTPAVINGPQAVWTRANPLNAPGIVMIVLQANSAALNQYCIQGGNCSFNNVTANSSTANNGTVSTLNSSNANLTNASGQSLSVAAGTISALTGTTATITNITGNLNGNATTSNTTSYATLAGAVPCSGVTGSVSNLCNVQPATCANNATNPPACNQFPPCANGATNPPACTQFPPCTNGATNPPACNNQPSNVCANGASNYPTCTLSGDGSCTYQGNTYPNGFSYGPFVAANNVPYNGQTCTQNETLTCVSGSVLSSNTYTNCVSPPPPPPPPPPTDNNNCPNGAPNPPICTFPPPTSCAATLVMGCTTLPARPNGSSITARCSGTGPITIDGFFISSGSATVTAPYQCIQGNWTSTGFESCRMNGGVNGEECV